MTTHGAIRGDTGHGDVFLLNDPCPGNGGVLPLAHALFTAPHARQHPAGSSPRGVAFDRSGSQAIRSVQVIGPLVRYAQLRAAEVLIWLMRSLAWRTVTLIWPSTSLSSAAARSQRSCACW